MYYDSFPQMLKYVFLENKDILLYDRSKLSTSLN